MVGSGFGQTVAQIDFSRNYYFKAAALGVAGAHRAVADTNQAIHLNPAGLAQKKDEVRVGGDYLYSGQTQSHMIGVTALDFRALKKVAIGFSYDRDSPILAATTVNVQQFTLASAYAVSNTLFVGNAVKGYITSFEGGVPGGPDGVDTDMGILFKPSPFFSMALTSNNLFKGHTFEEFPFMMAFALAMSVPEKFTLSADVVRNFNTPSKHKINAYFGAEVVLNEGIFLRGGAGLDYLRDNHFFTAGGALRGPKINVLFSYARYLNPSDNTLSASVEMAF